MSHRPRQIQGCLDCVDKRAYSDELAVRLVLCIEIQRDANHSNTEYNYTPWRGARIKDNHSCNSHIFFMLANRLLGNRLLANRLIAIRLIANRLLANRSLANRLIANCLLANSLIANRLRANRLLTKRSPHLEALGGAPQSPTPRSPGSFASKRRWAR